MNRPIPLVLSVFVASMSLLSARPLEAQAGTASGSGTIDRLVPGKTPAAVDVVTEKVKFSPRYSHAYTEKADGTTFTWVVLTEKEPPLKEWASAKDRAETRRVWCGKEKASFVAVKLDAKMAVDLYFLCPANGLVNTEMLSSANGLDSVAVKLDKGDGKRLKGTLRTGQGSCSGTNGANAYCTQTGDFAFDAPLSK